LISIIYWSSDIEFIFHIYFLSITITNSPLNSSFGNELICSIIFSIFPR